MAPTMGPTNNVWTPGSAGSLGFVGLVTATISASGVSDALIEEEGYEAIIQEVRVWWRVFFVLLVPGSGVFLLLCRFELDFEVSTLPCAW